MSVLYEYEARTGSRLTVESSNFELGGVYVTLDGATHIPSSQRVKLARAIAGDQWGEDPRVEKLTELLGMRGLLSNEQLAEYLLDNGVEVPA